MNRPLLVVLFSVIAWMDCRGGSTSSVFGNGEGVNGTVNAIVVQGDGKIILGGAFAAVNGVARQNLARLNGDGTLDVSFVPQYADGVDGPVFALAIHPAGGVIVGGAFAIAGNTARRSVARYQDDGTVDKNYGSAEGGQVTNGVVRALAVQSDGKVVLGGTFSTVLGSPRRSLARLNADGTLDAAVSTHLIQGPVNAMALLGGGGTLSGGQFAVDGKVPRSMLKSDN